jgi:GAF domain-containing protein
MSDQMPLGEELGRVYARMSGLLLSEETVDTALDIITSLALDTVEGAVAAGVTLLDDNGDKESAAATSEVAARADALQYELDEGPCLTASRTRQLVRIDVLEQDNRWPRWREAALGLGLRACLSAPMMSQGRVLGAIKVYGREPGTFVGRSESLMPRYADQAAILLANVASLEQASRLSENLQQALRARNVIAMASGILMERHQLSEEQAFLRLVEGARASGHELVAEATRLIDPIPGERG